MSEPAGEFPAAQPRPETLLIWTGNSFHYSQTQVDKHVLVYELGVRYRDLLTLDPTLPLPFPAAILIRNRALIINLETVRMIICANQCYVLSVPDVRAARWFLRRGASQCPWGAA